MAKGSYTIDINEKTKPFEFGYLNQPKATVGNPNPITIPKFSYNETDTTDPNYAKILDLQTQQLQSDVNRQAMTSKAAPVAAGIQAGSQIVPRRDTASNIAQVGGAVAAGALTGASVGGAYGAVIGGVAGLVTGGINAYLGSKSARETKRQVDAENRRITALNERSRRDQLKQQAFSNRLALTDRRESKENTEYNKKTNSIQSLWNNYDRGRKNLNDMIAGNQQLKDYFISRGR